SELSGGGVFGNSAGGRPLLPPFALRRHRRGAAGSAPHRGAGAARGARRALPRARSRGGRMKGLLKKDILLAVKTYKFILIVCIVLFAVRFFAEEVSVAVLLPVMFAGMLPTSL